MRSLSQREEQVMLAIWALKDDAYLVSIKKYLSNILGKNWTLSALHTPLQHLEDAGLLKSFLGEATSVRGGRAKRIYRITPAGLKVLTEYKRMNDALWADFSGIQA